MVSTSYQLQSYVPLLKRSAAYTGLSSYEDAYNGSNLVAKATQLVKDLEVARTATSFESLFESTSLAPEVSTATGEDVFEKLLSDIRTALSENDKPLTVLNVYETQLELSSAEEKDIDIET